MTDNNLRKTEVLEQDTSLPVGLEPTFLISEGTRQELNLNGYATSPFTGQLLVGTGDSPRVATKEEYEKAARENAKREDERPNKGKSFSNIEATPARVASPKRVARD